MNVTLPKPLAEEVLEHLNELKAERSWWRHEPRCSYQSRYEELCQTIEKLKNQIDSADSKE